MVSSKILTLTKFNLLFLLLAIFQSLHQISHPATADHGLIEIVCHESDTPEVCVQCLNSDPGATSADKVGLTTIVVSCVSNQANSLEEKLSNMSSMSEDQSSKDVLMKCIKGYSKSKEDLLSAIVSLKSGNYDDAERSVILTLYTHKECAYSLKEKKEVKISSQVAYEMKVYKDLCQIADRIIEQL